MSDEFQIYLEVVDVKPPSKTELDFGTMVLESSLFRGQGGANFRFMMNFLPYFFC